MPDLWRIPHGTKHSRKRQHPVLDIKHWEAEFPLGDERRDGPSVESPGDVASIEQARRLAKSKGKLGPSVPADLFVWSLGRDSEKPWLTQLGGTPWREKGKPWPTDSHGVPLHFLGQICFADSRDILPCKLPKDVALIFGRWQCGWVMDEDLTLEWSPLKLKKPLEHVPGWTTELPFCYQGVIHRSVQYTEWKVAEIPFKKAGWKEGGWGVHSAQVTSVGTYAQLPQGWPFEKNDGHALIATLNSFYFGGRWPLCNVREAFKQVRRDGSEYQAYSSAGLDFGVGDAGCLWIYRDSDGSFKLGGACG